jgi:hypothetical protein
MPQKVRVLITVKEGPLQHARVVGRWLDADTISVGDLQRVIEFEQTLERLTGYRYHIETETLD